MRESTIEHAVVEHAKLHGWHYRKLKWIGRRGAPDKFFIKNGVIIFVEFKAPGKRPRGIQAKEIKRLRDHGATVLVIDNIEAGCEAFS